MSRRMNILLLLTLAAGVAYGWLGVPFLLPFVSDEIEEAVEEPQGQLYPEIEEMRVRMLALKVGMAHGDVAKVLDLASKSSGCFSGDGNSWMTFYYVRPKHKLWLRFSKVNTLLWAELCSDEQVVARFPAATMTQAK
jgi:hypothetical protein